MQIGTNVYITYWHSFLSWNIFQFWIKTSWSASHSFHQYTSQIPLIIKIILYNFFTGEVVDINFLIQIQNSFWNNENIL